MLEPLFYAELDYQPRMPPLASEVDGAHIGNGDGTVHGPKLNGKLEENPVRIARQHLCPIASFAR